MPETSQNQETQVTYVYDISDSIIQLQPGHPLYLHPNDHPGMTLVYGVLINLNFTQWKISITIVLSAKNKIGIINGSNKTPASQSKYAHA